MTSWQRALHRLETDGRVEVTVTVLAQMMQEQIERAHWSIEIEHGIATVTRSAKGE